MLFVSQDCLSEAASLKSQLAACQAASGQSSDDDEGEWGRPVAITLMATWAAVEGARQVWAAWLAPRYGVFPLDRLVKKKCFYRVSFQDLKSLS